ncbi:hypothetical protein B1T45_19405 [Mycobacterium kansasii]|nr:hypothetical protein B1T43_18995 [Mycobacterium kansasii]ARG63106.1 hypothetical protein B1T45_19405 [Mycobacterium kansasii]ARG70784.1 hypothetical protein B1T47_19005 [Mycobacterium kansasii]
MAAAPQPRGTANVPTTTARPQAADTADRDAPGVVVAIAADGELIADTKALTGDGKCLSRIMSAIVEATDTGCTGRPRLRSAAGTWAIVWANMSSVPASSSHARKPGALSPGVGGANGVRVAADAEALA